MRRLGEPQTGNGLWIEPQRMIKILTLDALGYHTQSAHTHKENHQAPGCALAWSGRVCEDLGKALVVRFHVPENWALCFLRCVGPC